MNQKPILIKLLDLVETSHPFGNALGKDAFRKLSDIIDDNPSVKVFGVSLEGIEASDASFPRESIVSVAKQFRGSRGIYLEGFQHRDIVDNWQYAASAKEQPLVIWVGEDFEVIGPAISKSTLELVNYVLMKRTVTTPQVAKDLNITVQNASTRLKNLVQNGYILRSDISAESGGIEFVYQAIK